MAFRRVAISTSTMSPAVGPYSSFSQRKSSTSTSSTAGVASPRSARFSSTLSSSIRWPRL